MTSQATDRQGQSNMRCLFATDGSHSAEDALAYLMAHYRPDQMEEVVVLTVDELEEPPAEQGPEAVYHHLWKELAMRILQDTCAVLERGGFRVRGELRQGNPDEWILEMVNTERPDLVVVGSHGRKGFQRLMLGSVSESVVRQSPVSVLVARRPDRP